MQDSMSQWVSKLGSETKDGYVSRRKIAQMLIASTGEERAKILGELAAELVAKVEVKDNRGRTSSNPKHDAKIRRAVCRLLGEFGSEKHAAELRQSLTDYNVREAARMALNQLPGKLATDALIEAAMEGMGNAFRLGAIASLARRVTKDVAGTLKSCAAEGDLEIALAAADALSWHADPANDEVIADVAKRVDEQSPGSTRMRHQLVRCRIQLAESLKKAGQREAGNKIFMSIQKTQADKVQKNAARIGMGGLSRVER